MLQSLGGSGSSNGKAKVHKLILARAPENTEDKAPVQLLLQVLSAALGEFREVMKELSFSPWAQRVQSKPARHAG
jgi:hypothetical protein